MEIETKRDIQLFGLAVSGQWDLKPELLKQGVEAVERHINSPDPKLSVAALKVLVEMKKANQRDEHKALDLQRDAQRQAATQINNNLIISSEAVYELLERQHQDPPTIEHKG